MLINTKTTPLLATMCFCFSVSADSNAESTQADPVLPQSSITTAIATTPIKRTESTLQVLLRITGISASPQQMRGEDKGKAGQVWIANSQSNKQYQVTTDNDFRSPVFLPNDTGLLALKKNEIIEISLPGHVQKTLFQIPKIVKIIGFDQSDKDRFLILLEDNQLELVSIKTAARTALDLPQNAETAVLLSHIKSWDREYGNTRVYVKTQRKTIHFKKRSISNIFYQHNQQDRDISHCKNNSCSQPSLSYDGTQVVFIKSAIH